MGANYGYDIAIVILANEIQFSSIVLPACLETDESTFNISDGAVGKVCSRFNLGLLVFSALIR